MGRPHLNSARLFFSIPKHVPFKKLNGTRQGGLARMGKILKLVPFTFDFVFIFIYFYLFFIFYIKINIFHKK